MASADRPTGEEDLDALIGDVRREAARRRASPDFPLEEEARLAAAMDSLGPAGPGVDLRAVLSELDRLSRSSSAAPRRWRPAPPAGITPAMAELVAEAVRGLMARIADLERRVDRATFRATGRGGTGGEPPSLEHWMPRVAGSVAAGRVLVAGAGAGAWVDALSEKGLDVYGIDPSRDRFGDDGLVRAADVESHLEQVDGKALALAVLLHPSGSDLATLAPSLYRTARAVAILSEAQWRWQQRIGPPSCDTRPDRPLMAETWIAGLAGAGFEATATYGPGGHDYLIEAS